jgi:hypothetical protein
MKRPRDPLPAHGTRLFHSAAMMMTAIQHQMIQPIRLMLPLSGPTPGGGGVNAPRQSPGMSRRLAGAIVAQTTVEQVQHWIDAGRRGAERT